MLLHVFTTVLCQFRVAVTSWTRST